MIKQRLYDDTNMLPDKSQLQKKNIFCLKSKILLNNN